MRFLPIFARLGVLYEHKSTVRLGYLSSFVDLTQIGNYDWGSAILGHLYTSMDSYVLSRCTCITAFWYILPAWYYEHFANMHPPLGAIAIGELHLFFPRMRRWVDEQILPRRPHGLQHELFHARQQIDMRSRGNFHLAA